MEVHIENELGPKKRPDLVAFIPFLKDYCYNTMHTIFKKLLLQYHTVFNKGQYRTDM